MMSKMRDQFYEMDWDQYHTDRQLMLVKEEQARSRAQQNADLIHRIGHLPESAFRTPPDRRLQPPKARSNPS
jgi:hypothetical protein